MDGLKSYRTQIVSAYPYEIQTDTTSCFMNQAKMKSSNHKFKDIFFKDIFVELISGT